MKNIGLLSLPMTWNYGGILQQYALQEVLGQLGHTTHILCRRQTRNAALEAVVALKWAVIPALGQFLPVDRYPLLAVESFKRKHLKNPSPPCFSGEALLKYVDRNGIDALVVGSDQVWNKGTVPDLFNYYLDFCEQRPDLIRLAYAPSFSKPEWDYTPEESTRCGALLKKFDAVSTREHIGVQHCREHFGVEAQLVPDPTLLLDASHYARIFENEPRHQGGGQKYVYSYLLDTAPEKVDAVRSVSQQLNAKVIHFAKDPSTDQPGAASSQTDHSVENWLGKMADAEFVVTDSFHGTVFALLFNKPFICFPNVQRGFERFTTLDIELGIGQRFALAGREARDILKMDMDWEAINGRRNQWASAGRSFLERALNKEDQP